MPVEQVIDLSDNTLIVYYFVFHCVMHVLDLHKFHIGRLANTFHTHCRGQIVTLSSDDYANYGHNVLTAEYRTLVSIFICHS